MNENKITIQNEHHHFSSDKKIEWLGYGEWVEEPDEMGFTYRDYQCRVYRIMKTEPITTSINIFGGHLCAYVLIPTGHPYQQKNYEDMKIDCHGGLTYGQCSDDYWIGFDCAHSYDLIPSVENLYRTDKDLIEIRKKFSVPKAFRDMALFNPTYKNKNFCIEECKSIVDQLIVIQETVENGRVETI